MYPGLISISLFFAGFLVLALVRYLVMRMGKPRGLQGKDRTIFVTHLILGFGGLIGFAALLTVGRP